MQTETIFIAPGYSQCRVYAMPYPMRPGQAPGDILPQFRDQWVEIALLIAHLKLSYISPEYADLAEEIAGQIGGTFFEVQRPSKGSPAAPAAPAESRVFDYQRYGIAPDQTYEAADGSNHRVKVVDVEKYADVGDVVVFDEADGQERRIDAFKLAMVRYTLVTPTAAPEGPWQPEPGQRIVCAASRFPCGTIVPGVRHYDMLMRATARARGLRAGTDVQGFVDQKGRFLTRQQAWKVAEAADQIRRRVGNDGKNGGTLYNENLY